MLNVMKDLCWQVQSGQSKPDMHMADIISSTHLFAWKPREASDSREQLSCTIGREPLSWRGHQPYSAFQSSFSAWHNQLLCSASRACTGRKCSIVEEISKCYLYSMYKAVLCYVSWQRVITQAWRRQLSRGKERMIHVILQYVIYHRDECAWVDEKKVKILFEKKWKKRQYWKYNTVFEIQ